MVLQVYTLIVILVIGCVFWHQNGVCRYLACDSSLRWSHDRGWVVGRCNQAKNGATILTLWYKPFRGETGLATSTLWLKFGKIGVQINRVPRRLLTTTGLCPAKPKKRTHWYGPIMNLLKIIRGYWSCQASRYKNLYLTSDTFKQIK